MSVGADLSRWFSPVSVPVPTFGRHSRPQSRASPSLRLGLQSPVPAAGRRTGGQSQSPAALSVAWHQPPQDSLGQLHRARPVAVVAVDEAHCVSEWGHDFRPAYHSVGQVRLKIMGSIIM